MASIEWMSRAVASVAALLTAWPAIAVDYPPVVPGYRIDLPRDEGSHPQFRTEWWYVTGWLKSAGDERRPGSELGFQITFFRTRPGTQEDNPSRFVAKQVLFAHAALSDVRRGRLLRGERSARAGFGLAEAREGRLDVHIDDWSLRQAGSGYRAVAVTDTFAFRLDLGTTQPPMLNGRQGFSQKGPDAVNASYYYSVPQLRVSGSVTVDGEALAVNGTAWLDHEWSSTFLDPHTQGWDWLGANLDDGGALMVQRLRDSEGAQRWAFASWRSADGAMRTFAPDEIRWQPGRRWRSARTGIEYPVEWQVRVGDRTLRLEPLMDDQESDTRTSTGTIYWEGATRLFDQQGGPAGRGYLELTGYGERLKL